jgi:uncharacterized protein (TIGR00661 family)
MKILYAIQGTGNGHIARAQDIIPYLEQHGQVDNFVSGAQAELALPFPVKYRSKGLSFYFGKSGGVNLIKTVSQNSARNILREVSEFPVEKYDLIINDFEPITAWAARKKKVPLVALSHQSAFLSIRSPRPKIPDPFGEWLFRNYAPAKKYIGFHFEKYDKNILTPVIRPLIRQAKPTDAGHYTVYLPAYDDEILCKLLSQFKKIRWQIFSKHCKKAFSVDRVTVYPVSGQAFVDSMVSSRGVLCGAGFETPAEALYLRKKLMVVPMQMQYEQQCNAMALKQMGVPRIKKLRQRSLEKIEAWLSDDKIIDVHFKDNAGTAVRKAIALAM